MMKMEIEEIKKCVANVDGWLIDREGGLLYNLAKSCTGKGVIVEIGSWKGKSTIWLGNGSKKGNEVRVYAIDPHTGSSEHKEKYGKVWTFDEFKKNISAAAIDDVVTPIVKTSEEAAKGFDKPIELLFIDGAHEYDLVKLDFDLWSPKVIEGGIIAFHDTIKYQGPKQVVKESIFKSKNFRNAKFFDSITFAQKVSRNSIRDRIRNRYVLLLKNIYEFAVKLHLPKPVRVAGRKIASLVRLR